MPSHACIYLFVCASACTYVIVASWVTLGVLQIDPLYPNVAMYDNILQLACIYMTRDRFASHLPYTYAPTWQEMQSRTIKNGLAY